MALMSSRSECPSRPSGPSGSECPSGPSGPSIGTKNFNSRMQPCYF